MPNIRLASLCLLSLLLLSSACDTDPRVACKKYVDGGNNYFRRGKFKEASILYRRALKKDARYADAWYRLGLTNSKLALHGEARKDFARAMEIDPANTDAMARLADLDLIFYALDPRANKAALADVKDLAQRLLKRNQRSYDGLRLSGQIALVEKDLKSAIERFEEANQSRPNQPDLVLALAQALFADGRDDRAEKLASELIAGDKTFGPGYDLLYVQYLRTRRQTLAEDLLKQKIANNPSEGAYRMQLAYHYYMTGRKPEMSSVLDRMVSQPQTLGDVRLQAGDFYVRIHEFDSAIAQYSLGPKENPKRKRVYQKKIVEVLAAQGKNAAASKLLAELMKEDAADPEARALHATLLLASNDPRKIKDAIAELEPLVAKTPTNKLLHFNLGRAYLASGDPHSLDQARIQFQGALKIDPMYLPAQLSMAELELARGESAKAVQEADQVLSADPSNPQARLFRARGLINMAEYRRARVELSALLQMSPGSSDARFELARLDLRERRYPEAEAGFEMLMAAGDARGLGGAIESRVQQLHWDQAIRFVRNLIQQSPKCISYRTALARLLLRAERYSEAAAEWQSLLDQNGNSAEIHLRLGECKVHLNDWKGAVAAFERARELAPNDAVPDLNLARLYEREGRLDPARASFEAALRKQPDNAAALNDLAYLDADQAVDLDRALAYAQRARAKLPDDPNVIDTLGLIYVRKNLTEDGLRMLRDVVNRRPDSATFHLHFAWALYQKGDRAMARKELEAARRNKPTEAEQSRIKELLAKVG